MMRLIFTRAFAKGSRKRYRLPHSLLNETRKRRARGIGLRGQFRAMREHEEMRFVHLVAERGLRKHV